jgi:RNA polymerase sigma factor (sigma-70 family)
MDVPTTDDLLRHAGFLRGLVRGLLADETAVDDVLQDTWTTAIERPPRRADNLRGWLGVVARNVARKRRRSDVRRLARERAAARPEAQPGPDDVVATLEWQRRVVEAVLRLDPALRALVVARFHEGRSVGDLARRAGVTPRTVSRRLHEATAALRADLDREAGGSRRTWAVALAPSLGAGGAVAGTAALAGGIAMGTKAVVGTLAGVAAAAIAGVVWLRADQASDRPEGVGSGTSEAARAPALAGRPAETAPQGRATFVVAGRVFDEEGRPVGGVGVEVREMPPERSAPQDERWLADLFVAPDPKGPVVARATSADDGTFSFPDLDPDARWVVAAVPDPPGLGTHEYLTPVPGVRRGVVLRVGRGSPLRLRVARSDGSGVRAWVSIHRVHRGGAPAIAWSLRDAATDASGRVVLGAAPEGALLVSAFVPGEARRSYRVTTPSADEVLLPWHDDDGVVTGRVLDSEGAGVPGARVVVEMGPTPRVHCAIADETGSYRARTGAGQVRRVVAAAPGYVPGAVGDGVEIAASATVTLDVTLRRAGRLRGTVRDGEGRPVAAAVVHVEAHVPSSIWQQEARADAEGRYAVDGLPGTALSVRAGAPGLFFPEQGPDGVTNAALSKPTHVPLASEGAEVVRDLVLLPGLRVTGTVLDDRGPAAGAAVSARRTQGGGGIPNPLPHDARDVVTDSSGRFELEGLAPGLWSVEARAKGARAALPEPIRLGAAAPVEPISLRLVRTGSVAGRVLRADGTPVREGWVRASPRTSVRVEPDGAFLVEDVLPGAHVLSHTTGLSVASSPVTVDPGQRVEGVVLSHPPFGDITGVLVDAQGRAVAGASIQVAASDGRSLRGVAPTTDAEGRFRVGGVPDGEYVLSARSVSIRARSGDEDVRLVVAVAAQDRVVRILDAEGNEVPRSTVTVMTSAGMTGGMTSVAVAPGLTPRIPGSAFEGQVDLTVERPCDADGRPLNLQPAHVRDVRPAPEPLEVRLRRGRRLAGRVLDERGRGVAGVGVAVRAVHPEDVVAWTATTGPDLAQTDADGAFEVLGLPAGALRARASAEAHAPGTWTDVAAGVETVTLRVVEGASIEGEVRGPTGAPLGAVEVRASPRLVRSGWARSAVTDAQGRFRLTGLPHGATAVLRTRVADEDLLPALAEGVAAGATGVVLRLERAHRVSGTVLDAAGRPPAGVTTVQAEPLPEASPRRPWGHGWVHDGRFEIRGLDGGAYRIRTERQPTDTDAPSEAVVVTPPANDVALRRRPGIVLRGRVVNGDATAGVRWTSASIAEAQAAVGADGAFEIPGLLDEPGTLHVHTKGSRHALLRDVRPSAGPVEVTLVDGAPIRGRVEIPSGVEAEHPYLLLRAEGVVIQSVVGPDRRFAVTGVPPGTYEAQLLVDGERSLHAPRVEAGAEDVVIRWEPPR